MKNLFQFIKQCLFSVTTGGKYYHLWMALLTLIFANGAYHYAIQLKVGLAVTGMNDLVSWGLYISNFTFLVGMAAAAVMLVLPSYILHDVDFSKAVLIGEGIAVGALTMCLLFVTVDLGNPQRVWHMLPVIGLFNWPQSMLTWDVLVLNGYLTLNLLIPFYILYQHFLGKEPDKKKYVPFVVLSVFWAVAIHLVTAFLYAGLPARPYWNSALLGPRFLASAFAAGPAFIIIVLAIINKFTDYKVDQKTFKKLGLITTIAAQINLIMLGSELFKEFYHPTEHSKSAIYLFFGLDGHDALVPWIRSAVLVNILITLILTLNPLRNKHWVLVASSFVLFIAIWIEKGMGLVVPGFIPSPLGEVYDYSPTFTEISVTLGIWAIGFIVLTVLIKAAIPIETGKLRIQQK